MICAVKYAVVRKHPANDRYLTDIVEAAGRERIVSGIGERPVLAHLGPSALSGFTSGSVCLAPRLSTALLHALQAGDRETARDIRERFLPLEDLRDRYSSVQVLHEALRLAGIAETGPMTPYLDNIRKPRLLSAISRAAVALRHADTAYARDSLKPPHEMTAHAGTRR